MMRSSTAMGTAEGAAVIQAGGEKALGLLTAAFQPDGTGVRERGCSQGHGGIGHRVMALN